MPGYPRPTSAADRYLIPVLALVNAVSVSPAVAQETRAATTVTVTGNVVNDETGHPVAGVVVVLTALDLTIVTDAQGQFVLDSVPRGVYDLRLIHKDYQHLDGDLTIDRPGEFFLGLTSVEDPSEGMITGIVGVVTDQVSGRPVPEVVVNVAGIGRVATTDENGRFSLSELIPGRHDVVFSHLGYRQRSESIEVETDHVVKLQIALTVDAIALDPIEVSVERRETVLEAVGFYAREVDGFGEFIDRMEIEERSPGELTDLFTRVPGAQLVGDASNPTREYIILRGGRTEGCFPRVLLDGVVVHPGGRQPANLDDLVNPAIVAGIEVFPSSAGLPVQYGGTGASCGVILIWTRR